MVADIAAGELLPRAEHVRRAADAPARDAALEEYRFQLELIVKAAAAMNLAALHAAGTHVLADVTHCRREPASPRWDALLVDWTAALPAYLRDPAGPAAAALAQLTAADRWLRPFGDAAALAQ